MQSLSQTRLGKLEIKKNFNRLGVGKSAKRRRSRRKQIFALSKNGKCLVLFGGVNSTLKGFIFQISEILAWITYFSVSFWIGKGWFLGLIFIKKISTNVIPFTHRRIIRQKKYQKYIMVLLHSTRIAAQQPLFLSTLRIFFSRKIPHAVAARLESVQQS